MNLENISILYEQYPNTSIECYNIKNEASEQKNLNLSVIIIIYV